MIFTIVMQFEWSRDQIKCRRVHMQSHSSEETVRIAEFLGENHHHHGNGEGALP